LDFSLPSLLVSNHLDNLRLEKLGEGELFAARIHCGSGGSVRGLNLASNRELGPPVGRNDAIGGGYRLSGLLCDILQRSAERSEARRIFNEAREQRGEQ